MTIPTFTNTDFTDFIRKTQEAEPRIGRHIMSTLRHLARSINNSEKNGIFGLFMKDRRYVYGDIKFMSSILDGLKKSQAWENLGKLRKLGIVLVEKIKNVHGWVNAYAIDIKKFFDLFYNNFEEDKTVKKPIEVDFDGGGSSGERTEGRPVSGLPTHYIYTSLKTTLKKDITVGNVEPVDNSNELPDSSNFPTNHNQEIPPLGLREENSLPIISEPNPTTQHCFEGDELLPFEPKSTSGMLKTMKLLTLIALLTALNASTKVQPFTDLYLETSAERIKYQPKRHHVDPNNFAETFQQLPPKTIRTADSFQVKQFKRALRGVNIDLGPGKVIWRPMPIGARFNLTTSTWEVRYYPYMEQPSSILPSDMD